MLSRKAGLKYATAISWVLLIFPVFHASAQIIPYGKTRILPSKVRDSTNTCGPGNCVIGGGDKRGRNIFYLFRQFNTQQSRTKSIRFENKPGSRVWIGVGEGPVVIDQLVSLTSKANITVLSPYGIALLANARLRNVNWAGFIRAAGFKFNSGGQFIPDTFDSPVIDKNTNSNSAVPLRLDEINKFSRQSEDRILSSPYPMVLVNGAKIRVNERITLADQTPGSSSVIISKSELSVPVIKNMNEARDSVSRGLFGVFSDGSITISDSSFTGTKFHVEGAGSSPTRVTNSRIHSSADQRYVGNLEFSRSALKSSDNIQIYGEKYLNILGSSVSARPKSMRDVGNIAIKIRQPQGSITIDKDSVLDVSGTSQSPNGGNIKLISAIKPSALAIAGRLVGRSVDPSSFNGNLYAYYIPERKVKRTYGLQVYSCKKECERGSVTEQLFRDISGSELASSAVSESVYSNSFKPTSKGIEDIDQFLQDSDYIGTARSIQLLGLEQGIDYTSLLTPKSSEIQLSLLAIRQQVEAENRERWHAIRKVKDASLGASLGDHREEEAFNPAVVYLSASASEDVNSLDISLVAITCCSAPFTEIIRVKKANLRSLLASFYETTSLNKDNRESIRYGQELYSLIFSSVDKFLDSQSVDTVLVFSDQAFQALPLGSMHDGNSFLASRYTFTISPSLALTNFPYQSIPRRNLLYLSSISFGSLQPLTSVYGERKRLLELNNVRSIADQDFVPATIGEAFENQDYSMLHVSAHADFMQGDPLRSVIYTNKGSFGFKDFRRMRLKRLNNPLDIISLSACRTALGDPVSELGFSGLALQSGSRTAIGSQWFVDDSATSAFFVHFYRLINAGYSKLAAFRYTQRAFLDGSIRISGSEIVGRNGESLADSLSKTQLERYRSGLSHPYFWAGIQMIGLPW